MLSSIKNKAFLFHQRLLLQTSNTWYHKVLRAVLYLISLLWKRWAYLRNLFFDFKIFRSYRLKIPVVSIGNIVAGGTGKTPLTIKLLLEISSEKMGLLSRGYRTGIQKQLIIEPDKELPILDEPALIRRKVSNLYCFLGKNRLKLGKIAEHRKMDLIVMDDGLQYRKLQKDFEIITMNAFDLLGQNHFLPRGFLRDHPKRLLKAHLIAVNYVKKETHYQKICSFLKKYCNAPIIGMHPILSFVDYKTNQSLSPPAKAGVFCGIAHPDNFVKGLIDENIEIVSSKILSDHEKISSIELEKFSKECEKKGAKCMICTEKDLVSFSSNLKLPIVLAKMDLKIFFGVEHWQLMIEKIQGRVNNAPLSHLTRIKE